jgi:hypothetical protein
MSQESGSHFFSIFIRDMMISRDLNFSRDLKLHSLIPAPSQSTHFYFRFNARTGLIANCLLVIARASGASKALSLLRCHA